MADPDTTLLVAMAAMQAMHAAGRSALPRETGGILVGFRANVQVVVTRALVVRDPYSTGHDYQLKTSAAKAELAQLRKLTPSVVGYVGDWHTHPTNSPPSRIDITSLETVARESSDMIALLVLPFDGAEAKSVHARLAHRRDGARRRFRPKVTVSTPACTISRVAPKDLEQLAQSCWIGRNSQ